MGNYRRTLAAATATILVSLSLYPIFYGFAWFWTGVAAVLTVALAGTLTRLRRLPVIVCLAGGLVALLLDLNIGYESPTSLFRVLPTPTSLRLLWDLVGLGFQESSKYAPPVPELPPMMFLATAGIGLTALLTDLIAVRLESAALAGLPLLLLFTEPFTLSISRTGFGMVVAFCLGTAGYLALLSSEGRDRIREWERPNPGPDELPDTRALATTGRRVGVTSVALALCIPLFIPGLHATRLFGSGQPGIGGTGAGTGTGAGVGFPDPNTQLTNELRESRPQDVFTYTTTDTSQQYFQVYVLDDLTSNDGFTLFSQPESVVGVSPNLPKAPGLTQSSYASPETTSVTLSRAVGQDDLTALPVPYPATQVLAPGQLRAEKNTLMVFDTGVHLSGLTYQVTSLDQSQIPQQALNGVPAPKGDITKYYTGYPSSYQPLRQLAEQVVAAAKAKTPFEEALALQEWLTSSQFKYTTNAPSIVDARGLVNFLTTTKRGYCQQFSFAMAVMARLLGIPSRVAYGYTAGTAEPDGTWLVTTHDAHAWPELYLQGYGWLRFEPTPGASDGGQGTAIAPAYTTQPNNPFKNPGTTSGQAPSGTTGHTPAISPQLTRLKALGEGGGAYTAPAPGLSGWQIFGLVMLGLLVLIMLAVAAPTAARWLIRRWRWRTARHGGDAALAHAAWRELRDDLVDHRAGFSLSESPRALAARVGDSLRLPPPAGAALRRVAMAEERARYAARPDTGVGLRQDCATIRRAIAAASPRRTRWLARLFPSSVITPVMIRFSQAADFSGRLNTDWFGKTIGSRRLGRSGPARAQSADETAARRSDALVTTGSRDR
jgi:transglutaminase-like putative cysteine protease